jgi:hypothetical protein
MHHVTTGGTNSVSTLSLANLSLLAATVSALLQAGAQLFAVAVIVGTVTEAPPRSLAMYSGEYGYDSGPFWEVMPTVTLALLLLALVLNWRTRRRRLLVSAVGAFLVAGLFAAFVMGPLQAEVVSAGFADSVHPALAARAARWHAFDWVSWALTLVPGLLLVLAISSPSTDPPRPSYSAT